MNIFLLAIGTFFLIVGVLFFYKHQWLLTLNRILRETLLNDQFVLLERRKKAFLFLLVAGLIYFLTYQRWGEKIFSTDRLLYQSLNYLYSGDFVKAKIFSEHALSRDSKNARALYLLAAAQLLSNEIKAGSKTWQKAAQIAPDSTDAKTLKALVKRFRSPQAQTIPLLD
jgi:tetratricopeptide (TPR) repeat protein